MKKIAMLAALVLAPACVDDNDIEGSGRLVDVRSEVAAFHAVEVADGIRAEIAVGPQRVVLHLDDNIINHVRVEVRNGVLVVEANESNMGFEPSFDAVVRITAPAIDAVVLHDGANAKAEVQGREVAATCTDGSRLVVVSQDVQTIRAYAHDGSGIVLNGSAVTLDIEARDGSNVGSAIPTESVIIRTHDGSGVRARASKSARIDASDGSKVDISGNPESREVNSTDGSSVTFSN